MGQVVGLSRHRTPAVAQRNEWETLDEEERNLQYALRQHLNHQTGHENNHNSSADCDATGTRNYSQLDHNHLHGADRTSNSQLPPKMARTAEARNLAAKNLSRQISSDFDTPSCLAYAPTNTHKGLSNFTGENNCFLNVTIQALWHLGPFRFEVQNLLNNNNKTNIENTEQIDDNESLIINKNQNERQSEKNSLVEALCNLFVQYEFSEVNILPPTELRNTLSTLYDQFQLGEIADANETLEAILERIHMECTPSCPYGQNKCLAHTVFGGLLMEQSICPLCGATSEPMVRNDFLHYIYAAELISLYQKKLKYNSENNSKNGPGNNSENNNFSSKKSRFGNLLHECLGVNPRSCPSSEDSIMKINEINGKNDSNRNIMSSSSNGNLNINTNLSRKNYENGYGYSYSPSMNKRDLMNTQQNLDNLDNFQSPIDLDELNKNTNKNKYTNSSNNQNNNYSNNNNNNNNNQNNIQNGRINTGSKSDHKSLHSKCHGVAEVKLHALDPASVLALSVGWTSSRESFETLNSFFSLMCYSIQLSDLFDIQIPEKYVSVRDNIDNNNNNNNYNCNKDNRDQKKYQENKKNDYLNTTNYPDTKNSKTNRTEEKFNSNKFEEEILMDNEDGEYLPKSVNFSEDPCYVFRGFVCYYGSHYISIFQVSSNDNCYFICNIFSLLPLHNRNVQFCIIY